MPQQNDKTQSTQGDDWTPFGSFFDKLRESSDPRELLDRLLHGLVTLLKGSRGFVMLKARKGEDLVPVASYEVEDTDEMLRISKTVYSRAIETDKIVFIDGAEEPDWLQSASMESLAVLPRSILCGPLKARDQVFGVIYLDGEVQISDVEKSRIPFFEVVTGLASELLAASQTRRTLLSTEYKLKAINRLEWEREQLVLGDGPAASQLSNLLDVAAKQDVSVLITGETGTGKEMVARALHRMSARQNGPFVPVNCASLPRDIIEAELFGAEKGAYTGATERRLGRFELASGGTLFLDELGELELDVQVKLLRVLEERRLTRLGGTKVVNLDFRLISATNRDLEAQVTEGAFRQDLFYRVNVFRMHLPPLRDRSEDIEPLAQHFLEDFAVRFGKNIKSIAPEAIDVIKTYPWRGNIRELRNAIERAVVIEPSDVITLESLPMAPEAYRGGNVTQNFLDTLPMDYEEARDIFDKAFFERSFKKNKGNLTAVGRETGLARNTLYRRLEKLNIKAK